MAEETKGTAEVGDEKGNAPAGGEQPEVQEKYIPYERFQKVVQERNHLRADYQKLSEEAAARAQKELEEQGKFQELYQAAQTQINQMKAEAEAARREALRVRIGAEMKLPGALIERLKGETEDELRADAAALASLVTPAAVPAKVNSPATSAANPAAKLPLLTKEDIKRLTPAEINERWDELLAALKG